MLENLANLRARQADTPPREITDLTKREKQVLELVCHGLDDAAISTTLAMSRNTVRNHIARICAKVGVNKRGAAIVWSRECGLAHCDNARAKVKERG